MGPLAFASSLQGTGERELCSANGCSPPLLHTAGFLELIHPVPQFPSSCWKETSEASLGNIPLTAGPWRILSF